MNYTNIVNNTGINFIYIITWNDYSLYLYLNIFKNFGKDRVLYSNGYLNLNSIIMYQNTHNHCLIRLYSGKLNLINSKIHYIGTIFTTYNGEIILNNSQTISSSIGILTNNFTHFSTYYCYAKISLNNILNSNFFTKTNFIKQFFFSSLFLYNKC